MTAPKKVRFSPAQQRQLLEDALVEHAAKVELLEAELELARGKRNRAIGGLGALPEEARPTSTDVSKIAGVSRQYVVRLWEE